MALFYADEDFDFPIVIERGAWATMSSAFTKSAGATCTGFWSEAQTGSMTTTGPGRIESEFHREVGGNVGCGALMLIGVGGLTWFTWAVHGGWNGPTVSGLIVLAGVAVRFLVRGLWWYRCAQTYWILRELQPYDLPLTVARAIDAEWADPAAV